MKKQILSLLLVVCMLLSILPMNVLAADVSTPQEETTACIHTAHTDCSYTPATAETPAIAGVPCDHVCGKECGVTAPPEPEPSVEETPDTENNTSPENAPVTAEEAVVVTISPETAIEPVVITTESLQKGEVGTPYSQTLTATVVTAPITWSISDGTLPKGLGLDASTGEISGIPTAAGTTFTVTAQDAASNVATKELRIAIAIKPGVPGVSWDSRTALYFEGGAGTIDDPYRIVTPQQLALLSDVINKGAARTVVLDGEEEPYEMLQAAHYKLTADILLNDTYSWEYWGSSQADYIWRPIGTTTNPFKGTFDGNSKTITGLYFGGDMSEDGTPHDDWDGESGSRYIGLFGIADLAVFQDLTIAKSYVRGYEYVGSLVGKLSDGTVANCINSGNVRGRLVAGGLLGIGKDTTVKACTNTGTISGGYSLGGIIGISWDSKVTNCQNSGAVAGEDLYGIDSGNDTGGIVGTNEGGATVENCQNTGKVSGVLCNIGGIAGTNYGTVAKCISLDELTQDATGPTGKYDKPGESHNLIGYIIGWNLGTFEPAQTDCTVTFDSDEGSEVAKLEKVVTGTTPNLPDSTRSGGYRFDGWFTMKNGGGTQYISGKTPIIEDVTLYAKWTQVFALTGMVLDSDGEVVVGAVITIDPAAGTSEHGTDDDGTFKMEVPAGTYDVTAEYPYAYGYSKETVPDVVIAADINIKIQQIKPYLTVTDQPKNEVLVAGLTSGKGSSATFRVEAVRTPFINGIAEYQWYLMKGTTPDVTKDIELSTKSGYQYLVIPRDEPAGNPRFSKRGVYPIYNYMTDPSKPAAKPVYSSVATLRVIELNTITGVVKKDGTPIGGATVKLELVKSFAPAGTPITNSKNPQTTDTDGKYTFDQVPDGTYNLIVTLPNGGGTIIAGPYDLPKTTPGAATDIEILGDATLTITAQPQDLRVRKGTPAKLVTGAVAANTTGAMISYQWYSNTKRVTDGATKITNAVNAVYAPPTATKSTLYYYCVVSVDTLTATTDIAKVDVFGNMTLHGTVTDSNYTPITGAVVQLISKNTPPLLDVEITDSANPQTTKGDGKYRFEEVPEGKYQILITLPDDRGVVLPLDLPKDLPTPPNGLPIVVPDTPVITIQQQPISRIAAKNNAAIFSVSATVTPNAALRYQWYKNTENAPTGGKAIDGATGASYIAPTAAAGHSYYYCVVTSKGATSRASAVAKLTVRNYLYMTIEGVVKDNEGRPLTGAEVTLTPKRGDSVNPQTTPVDGTYLFEGLPIRDYVITVTYEGYTVAIPVNPGDPDGQNFEPEIDQDITISTANIITILTQPKGATMTTAMAALFTIKAMASKNDRPLTYQWFKNGEALGGEVNSTLTVPEGQAVGTYTYQCVVSSIDATEVKSADANLMVTEAPANNGDLDGDIIDGETGKSVEGVAVKLMKFGTNGKQFGATVYTDAQGKFEFKGIPYDSYSLVASIGAQIITKQLGIEMPQTTQQLTLPSGEKTTTVEVVEGAPSTAAKNLNDLFTPADGDIAKQEGAVVDIKLVIRKENNPSDKEEIEAKIDLETQKIGLYLDAQLIKTITGTGSVDGSEPIQPPASQPVGIVLNIPLELQGKAPYTIIYCHDGVADTIIPVYSEMLQTLTFGAPAFSTYAVAITGTPSPTTYKVTVAGGGAGSSGGGDHGAGDIVNIDAGNRSGYTFNGWTVTSGSANLVNASSAITTFIMPASPVTVTANWTANGGGGGGSDRNDPSKPVENPKVAPPDHGDVTVKPTAPKPGDVVTITPQPDDGYQTKDVVVTDSKGNEIPVTDNGDGSWSYTQPSGEVTVVVTFEKKPGGLPFVDVTPGDWFYDSVKTVYENGWMDGTSATTFAPQLSTTRGMITTILWRMEGEPSAKSANPFADVSPEMYYAKAVAWGAENVIVKGYGDGNFGPNDPVTREQLAAILHRYAQWKGMDTAARGDLAKFTDQPTAWALENVRWAVGAGLITGKGNGLLDPTGHATRAETAAMLARFAK